MARKPRRVNLPDGITYEQLMKSCLILVASSEIALDQLTLIAGSGSNFYRQELKSALNNAIKVTEPYVAEFLDWGDEPDGKAEKEYYRITTMIENFTVLLAETPGSKLEILDNLLTSFKNGDFKTVSEEEFEVLSSKEGESGGHASDDSKIGAE
jgi:hypothetical protein